MSTHKKFKGVVKTRKGKGGQKEPPVILLVSILSNTKPQETQMDWALGHLIEENLPEAIQIQVNFSTSFAGNRHDLLP